MIDLPDRSNYVRAETLTVPSPEFVFLLALAGLFLFASRRRLVDLFVLTIPLTDQIYRVGPLQPSDVVAILLLLKHRRIYFAVAAPYLIVPVFLLSSVAGYFFSSNFFSLLYAFRFTLVLVAINYLYVFAKSDGPDYYRTLYCKALILSVALQVTQLVWWALGFEQAGVFLLEGFPRIKGTAHEPATFAATLALSLPFCVSVARFGGTIRVDAAPMTVLAIAIGLLLSLSVTGFVIALLFTVLVGLLLVRFPFGRRTVVAALVISTVTMAVVHEISEDMFDYTWKKAIAYPQEIFGDEDTEDVSGRASDRRVLDAVREYPVSGIGVFNTAQVARYVEVSAANMYFTFLLELGIPLYGLFLAWLLVLMRSCVRQLSIENALYVAGFLTWTISLLGLRTFAFYLPWVIFVFVFLASRQGGDSARASGALGRFAGT